MSLLGEEKYDNDLDFDRIVQEIAKEIMRRFELDMEPARKEMVEILTEIKALSTRLTLLEIEQARRLDWLN